MGEGEPPGDELEDGTAESIRKESGRVRDGKYDIAMEVRKTPQSL